MTISVTLVQFVNLVHAKLSITSCTLPSFMICNRRTLLIASHISITTAPVTNLPIPNYLVADRKQLGVMSFQMMMVTCFFILKGSLMLVFCHCGSKVSSVQIPGKDAFVILKFCWHCGYLSSASLCSPPVTAIWPSPEVALH